MTDTAARPAADSAAPPPPPPPRGFRGGPWGTLVAIAFGVVMVALDGTIVAVANPDIARDLSASLAELQWVTHGYLLGLAVFLITSGKLGDRYGHRRVYLVGVVGFTLTSIGIALSGAVPVLVGFRILQGVFGATIAPAAMGLLRSNFPPHMLGRAFGVFGSILGGAMAAGPIVGGMLVSAFGWEAAFLINLPLGAVTVAAALWLIGPNRATDPASRLDIPGILLLSVAIFALVWALVEAPVVGWAHPETLAVLAVSLAFGAGFALWQARAADPLMPLGIFRLPALSIGVVLMVLTALGLMGSLFFVTFYLQGVRDLSPMQTGLQLLPLTLMMGVCGTPAGRVMDRFGTRVPTVAGLLTAAAGLFLLSRLSLDTGVVATSAGFLLLGIGLSLVMTGATAAMITAAPVSLAGVASGLQQTAMQLGGSLGTAVLGAVLSLVIVTTLPGHFADAGLGELSAAEAREMQSAVSQGGEVLGSAQGATAEAITRASNLAFLDGMHLAFGISAAVMVAAAVLAMFMKPQRHDTGSEVPVVHI
ncbi:MFS transporter [Streptomonospora nanhaiensis]|uniref:EmrB/QacA subfamily drug resistance transporter n=1 Tax=Streptomonospora nanhaiensis TaxID=1323731 RepID=A0A853BLF0_9ACTN|nr:MFS transporter [Streptomonospora nanhaiensis]MBV2365645.1 MFS transporter [Streptomonospora nanhaiensis]MBX9389031.1 MFS transporter [Streptomonospora nanhaiensis]NYI95545.1 EmrB/QacA subfamily drug resistance transporter [Streptomonospora nanhaiensis]